MKSCCLTSISWSSVITQPTLIAVGANGGTSGDKTERFGLFQLVHNQTPSTLGSTKKEFDWERITDPLIDIHSPSAVYEVAFAPACGRRYHVLAIATNQIRVIKIEVPFSAAFFEQPQTSEGTFAKPQYSFTSQTITSTEGSLTAEEICCRLSWNSLGSILGASNGDGSVRLFKQNHSKQWICVSKLGTPRTNPSKSTPQMPSSVSLNRFGASRNEDSSYTSSAKHFASSKTSNQRPSLLHESFK